MLMDFRTNPAATTSQRLMSAAKSRNTLRSVCWRVLRCVLLVGCILGILVALSWWFGPLRPLQLSSAVASMQEYEGPVSGNGDGNRCFAAECDSEFFHSYAHYLGLVPVPNGMLPRGCTDWGGYPVSWWVPPADLSGAYYRYEQGHRILLAYYKGVLYCDIQSS